MGAWYGSKATTGLGQAIVGLMRPHDTYIETHLGGGAIMKRKPPALRSIGIDLNARSIGTLCCDYEVELVHGCCHRFPADYPFEGSELVYSDPPNLMSTRKSQHRYRYRYGDADHEALHVDETGFRVDGKTQWLHVVTDGALTLKFVHPKRGGEAIEDIGIIPRYAGTLVHDCRAAYFVYDQCTHQLCGSHLLRELTFIVDSNGFRWARLMKKLLREACHRVNKSDAKTLTAAERRAVRKRYRTILTQGGKELPEIPPRPKGKRGRVAKSDARNLHVLLAMHEESVLRFTGDPDISFTNNAQEQTSRMAKVKIKVSGCFRIQPQAKAWYRTSSYLNSMAALGYKPLVAIQIALAGDAAAMIAPHQAQTAPGKA